MGSPLSGFLAEFKPLENDILKNIKPAPSTWIKYADDLFVVWEHGLETLKDFLKKKKKIDNDIQFTMEIESNNTLPFLDILLLKEDNKINRKVYQKIVNLDHIIPNDAVAPRAYKLSALKSCVHREFKVCLDQYLKEEINYVIKIASNNFNQKQFIRLLKDSINQIWN